MKSFCLKQYFLRWRRVLTLTRVTTVSVSIVAETCARRGAGFSRFLQLVPGEGESQTTGKLCVLHFFYKGQLNIASLCNGRTKQKWNAMLNLESGDRIELFREDSPEATSRATVTVCRAIGTKEWAFYEFKNRAAHRESDRDCPSVRTVCARGFLSILFG